MTSYTIRLRSGLLLRIESYCDESPSSAELVGSLDYTLDAVAIRSIAALQRWAHVQYTQDQREIVERFSSCLDEQGAFPNFDESDPDSLWSSAADGMDELSWTSPDHAIALLAVLDDPDGWRAAGSPETLTIRIDGEGSAFWFFHDLAHARLHWSVDEHYSTDGDDPSGAVFGPAELLEYQEIEAHELGLQLARAAGMAAGEVLRAVFDWQTLEAHQERFGTPLDASQVLTEQGVACLALNS